MMLRYQFGLESAAARLEATVDAVLDAVLRTPDIYAPGPGIQKVGCKAMAEALLKHLK